jgi:hypothetical protein
MARKKDTDTQWKGSRYLALQAGIGKMPGGIREKQEEQV